MVHCCPCWMFSALFWENRLLCFPRELSLLHCRPLPKLNICASSTSAVKTDAKNSIILHSNIFLSLLEWSYNLITPTKKTLFGPLAIQDCIQSYIWAGYNHIVLSSLWYLSGCPTCVSSFAGSFGGWTLRMTALDKIYFQFGQILSQFWKIHPDHMCVQHIQEVPTVGNHAWLLAQIIATP